MTDNKKEFEEDVFPAELEEINKRRERLGLPGTGKSEEPSTENELIGLSLSGGGIRSATFSLGIIQGLAKHGVLKHVDYLSTVSGGGYTGSCISSLLNDPENSTTDDKFPLRYCSGAAETPSLTHLRNSSNYLSPGGLLEKLRIPNVLLRGIVLNLLVFLPGIMLAVMVTDVVFEFTPHWDYLPQVIPWLALAFVFLAVAFPIVVKLFRKLFSWRGRNFFELVLTIPLLIAGIILALIPLLEVIRFAIEHNFEQIGNFVGEFEPEYWWVISFVFLAVLFVFMAAGKASQNIANLTSKLIMLLVGLLGPTIIFSVYAILDLWQIDSPFVPLESDVVLNQSVTCLSGACTETTASANLVVDANRELNNLPTSTFMERWTKAFGPAMRIDSKAGLIAELHGRSIEFYDDAIVLCQSGMRAQGSTPAPVSCTEREPWSEEVKENPRVWVVVDAWSLDLDGEPDATDFREYCPPLHELREGDPFVGKSDDEIDWINNNCTYFAQHSARSLFIDGASLSFFEAQKTYIFFGLLVLLWIFNRMLLDINITSPHGFYRDRLSKAFLFRSREGEIGSNDDLRLQQLNSDGTTAPYHLINVALNLQGSKAPDLRGRMCDFFIFSKHFTGGDRTGYVPTTEMEHFDSHLNLGTACAISGAAAAPNMGTVTNRSLVFILTVLNIRLGYWLPNPRVIKKNAWNRGWLLSGAKPSLIWSEATGSLSDTGSHVNVSDGGHLENLGIYPLLKRRCKYIIAVDGEADPDFVFDGLVKTMRFARIDMGVEISLDLEGIRKDMETNRSAEHFSVGTIHYGDGETGVLLYFKLSVTGDEPEYVRAYRAKNPAFPHESTADQFFSEEQFEAYRALGEHICEHCMGDSRSQSVLHALGEEA